MSEQLLKEIAEGLADVKKLAEELTEMRELLADTLHRQKLESCLAETRAEIAMVDAMGLDPATYLKNKYKQSRSNKRTDSRKKARSASI